MHPFFGDNFTAIWTKYFNDSSSSESFEFISPVRFAKSKFSLFYYNVGKNITNGMFYGIDKEKFDYKGKAFLIYDVLSYLDTRNRKANYNLSIKRITQYQGYLSNLDGFNGFDDFFSKQFSSKSRTNLRKHFKRLENNFNVSFDVFYGDIAEDVYDKLFDELIELISRRFSQLGRDNDVVESRDYYHDLCYRMINSREAALFVIYHDDDPIAISICFLSDVHVYFAITTFDVNFRRYNLGHILIMKIMKWCFENGFKTLDYSKGIADYKLRWSNASYDFEHHVIYDAKSPKSRIVGVFLSYYFGLIQFLRKKRFNFLYSRMKYLIKNKNLAVKNEFIIGDNIAEEDFDKGSYVKVEKYSDDYKSLKPLIYDLIYSSPQNIDCIRVLRRHDARVFIIKGDGFVKECSFV